MKVSTEVIQQVWNDDEGVCIEVGMDADSLGMEIRTGKNEASKEWFGDAHIALGTKEFADALAAALLNIKWPD